MKVIRYTSDKAEEWNVFVRESKNGTFLFERGYMDYHADRFHDHSLMYYDLKGKLLAVLPANRGGDILYSHQGLTYGGFVLSAKVTTVDVLQIFTDTFEHLKTEGITTWYYKQMPTIYHLCPAQEDEYALWRFGATLESCLISTTIPLASSMMQPKIERRRRRGETKARAAAYEVCESNNLECFWHIMEKNLHDRYDVRPVHTVAEMQMLKERFPENIKCFLVKNDCAVEAGCIVYIANSMTVHIQYGHATPQGKQDGALDLLYCTLIERYKSEGYQYLDFGNSNEEGGRYLNENLIAQKEGFGGRGIVYKQYKIEI